MTARQYSYRDAGAPPALFPSAVTPFQKFKSYLRGAGRWLRQQATGRVDRRKRVRHRHHPGPGVQLRAGNVLEALNR